MMVVIEMVDKQLAIQQGKRQKRSESRRREATVKLHVYRSTDVQSGIREDDPLDDDAMLRRLIMM